MGDSAWNCCSATKRTLENLCVANAWSYATFWAFDLSNPMLLTLEDSYYEDRLGLPIHNLLLNKVHMLGQGIIGQAALNGKHQWILADGFGLDRNSFQVDSESYSQFSSGIKTIVAIPVEPRGVIQFGSTHKICESLDFVGQVIRSFREIHDGVDQVRYDANELFSSTSTSYISQDPCSDRYLQGGPGSVLNDHGRYTQQSIFEGFFEDFNQDDFPTPEDLSRWLAPSPPPPEDQIVDDLTRLVESTSTQKDIPGPSSAFAPEPRKGLFSELGIEELLAGGSSSATSCLTSSNLDRSCSGKRREAGKSQVSLWIDDTYSIVTPSSSNVVVPTSSKQQQKLNEDQRRVVRKRARPGESTRPRPKDRQLIQDRIKELRGIIPNSSKCSIDSLLERTIKYMAFLQGVTKHGDKLKQATKSQLIGNENGAVLRDKSKSKINGGGGATWAYEVGGQSMACPIIVEDLSQPGQMLIEMLCEEQGFFLEITDVVRGFGLSILKGVMEARGDKIWAHFIVEARSHVTRIDVFWSLVRVLQRTINSDDKPSGNSVFDNGIPLLESYHKPNLPRPICVTETL